MQLVAIFNACLRFVHFLSKWKCASVILIKKPGKDPSAPDSYRPISLISNLGKIFEKIILERLNKVIGDLKIIPNEQFGFKKRHSMVHQIVRVVEQATSAFNTDSHMGAVFLDCAKAFDKIWHEGLLFKMIKWQFPPRLLKLIQNFICNRKFFC